MSIWPEAYLILRLEPQTIGTPKVVMRNVSGAEFSPTLCCGDYRGKVKYAPSVAGNWADIAAARLRKSVAVLDKLFPRRIINIHLMGLHTGEWFMPSSTTGGPDVPRAGFWDYSEPMQRDFLTANPTCASAVPTPQVLDSPTKGNSFLDGSTVASRCAIQWNRFMSASVATALNTLGRAVKTQSQGKCLVTVYNGYTYALGGEPGNGHWAMATLMADSAIDFLASPLLYGPPTRAPWGAPLVMGAADSPALYGKTWAMESDTRTCLCSSTPDCAGFPPLDNVEATVQRFRRNLGSAAVQGRAAYALDLNGYGWLGRPDRTTDSQALWKGLGVLFRIIAKISSDATGDTTAPLTEKLPAQIAVFTDSTSIDLTPLSGPHSGIGPGGGCPTIAQNQLKVNAMTLSTLGAPVLHLSTQDLLSPRLDTTQIRLAVFLNAVLLTPRVVSAIRSRFQEDSTTVVWLGPSGLVANLSGPADLTSSSRLTGLPIRCNATNASLAMRFSSGNLSKLPAFDSAGGCRPSPACFVEPGDSSVTVLATENEASGACTNILGQPEPCATMVQSRARTIWTSAVSLPWPAWRSLAVAAGVHLFIPQSSPAATLATILGDTVSISSSAVSGPANWLHLTAACPGLSSIYATTCVQNSSVARSIVLPNAARVIDEDGRTVCDNCTQFTTAPLHPGDVAMYRLQLKTDDVPSFAAVVHVTCPSRYSNSPALSGSSAHAAAEDEADLLNRAC